MTARRGRPVNAALGLLLVACSGAGPAPPVPSVVSPAASVVSPAPTGPRRVPFSAERALGWVRAFAGAREAASPAYRRASGLVAAELRRRGFAVRFEAVRLPAGRSSDGRSLAAGVTRNVVAEPPGLRPLEPRVVVGAHLDSVPGSPGANDNASGIAVMLELARLAAAAPPAVPVVFVAFGGEERRRPGELGNLFGSRAFVAGLGASRRRAIRAMLSLDMVGAGRRVLVCRTRGAPGDLARRILDRARRLGIAAGPCTTRTPLSDHGSFERAGIPAAWLWAGMHPSLHRPSDTAGVVSGGELDRVGRLAWDVIGVR